MNRTLKHLDGIAGTSITKAMANTCRTQTCPIVASWHKHQQTDMGSRL
ncbi:MAG TPA: hypothetical protein PK879_06440 [Opitutaceae bacterium]|nr:hypothetical protein [Opitutaceae bacterium]HOR25647.1 hypothetical protein [Opitutaceae bacterium]HOY54107.1 hypothetical protein [Opitutaceae bacterium]HPK49973.1 hypothetical protein [Opitutaceae bacterium]HPO00332.1 hypothetical protein [Opitutaceae bacterium]